MPCCVSTLCLPLHLGFHLIRSAGMHAHAQKWKVALQTQVQVIPSQGSPSVSGTNSQGLYQICGNVEAALRATGAASFMTVQLCNNPRHPTLSKKTQK